MASVVLERQGNKWGLSLERVADGTLHVISAPAPPPGANAVQAGAHIHKIDGQDVRTEAIFGIEGGVTKYLDDKKSGDTLMLEFTAPNEPANEDPDAKINLLAGLTMPAGMNVPAVHSKAKMVEVMAITACCAVWFWMFVLIIYCATHNDLGALSTTVYILEFFGSALLLTCALRGINVRNTPCLSTMCCGSEGGCLDWHGLCSYCCGCFHFVAIFLLIVLAAVYANLENGTNNPAVIMIVASVLFTICLTCLLCSIGYHSNLLKAMFKDPFPYMSHEEKQNLITEV